jgi:hypothetical protein
MRATIHHPPLLDLAQTVTQRAECREARGALAARQSSRRQQQHHQRRRAVWIHCRLLLLHPNLAPFQRQRQGVRRAGVSTQQVPSRAAATAAQQILQSSTLSTTQINGTCTLPRF